MMDWIAAERSAGQLRLWMQDGSALAGPVAAPRQEDMEQALSGILEPHLRDGRTLPVLLCGETHAACVAAPSVPPGLRPLTGRDPRLAVQVVPGLVQKTPPDLMQGQETRIAGLLADQPDFDGVICVTGARSVWAHVSAGEIVSFRSFMSVEVFGLLAARSGLAAAFDGGWDADAFAAALDETLSRPERGAGLLASVAVLHGLGALGMGGAAARVAGALLGQELAAARPYWLGRDVALIGEGGWPARYATALELQGVRAPCHDGVRMMVRGLAAARDRIGAR